MPKKSKRESQKLRKKKVSTADNPLANTSIKIVDEGESGIDITEEIRKKEEAAKKAVVVASIVSEEKQTFVQTKEEIQAIRNELKGDEIVSEVNEFVVSKPERDSQTKNKQENSQTYLTNDSLPAINESTTTECIESQADVSLTINMDNQSLRTLDSNQASDSLAVNVGSINMESQSYSRQTTMESTASVNSSFSYFSDNNLAEKGDLSLTETQEACSQAQSSVSSNFQEGIVSNESENSVTQTIKTVVTSTKKISNRQLSSSKYENNTAEAIEANEEHQSFTIRSASITQNIESGEVKKRQHVSQEPGDDDDIFLEELKQEIIEKREEIETPKHKDTENDQDNKKLTKRNSGWDNIFIKKEIKLELKKPEIVQGSTSSESEDLWKEQLKEIKRKGETFEERTLHEYFEQVQTKVFNSEMGYGYVSENVQQPKVKVVLKGNSPFLKNEMKSLHIQLANLHLYSQIYRVVATNTEDTGRTFYIFRHYLDMPSLTNEEIKSLKIAACRDADQENIEFIDPLYVDSDFVVVEQDMFSWFLVVSEFPNLPIRVNLVPFMQKTKGTSPIFICPLPRGRHHISKVVQENPGWRKCGYEEPCVIQKGVAYSFSTDVWGQKENIGSLKIETWGHDSDWVIYKPEMFKAQDFIESTLCVDGSSDFVFSGPLSLYDRLRVDVEVPFYQKKLISWEIATIDQAILADLPSYGKISNLEPFFAYVRAGRLNISQLKAILTHMGYSDVPGPSSSIEDSKISALVQSYLQDWKEKNGSQATLIEFLSVLRMADVALTNIAMEIIQNIGNSKCGIAAYSIN